MGPGIDQTLTPSDRVIGFHGDSPGGTTESSPAIYRWESSQHRRSPGGTKEIDLHVRLQNPNGGLSSLRDSATRRDAPAMNRWAYSYPRVIHRSQESPKDLLAAASVNNSAAQKVLGMNLGKISPNQENTHRPATNFWARHSTPKNSPSSRAMRWSLTNTQWRTASISRSHYKPFARISQRVFSTR